MRDDVTVGGAGVKGTGVQNRLLELLEYRTVLGALVTTPDGLLVATAAISFNDAELIAATAAVREDREDQDSEYWDASSEHGSLRVVNGSDMRLIVLTEPDATEPAIRNLMRDHLRLMEDSISV